VDILQGQHLCRVKQPGRDDATGVGKGQQTLRHLHPDHITHETCPCLTAGQHLGKLAMNTVEDEVVELVSSVLARMTFRLLRQAEPRNRFPVHLLLEEAHRYISETPSKYAIDASKIYERIAKEGRKYGLFLLVASQRPSELSKTVLSQCSNFVIHRIQNPDDLSQIRQMTPFISDAVLKRLPSLPKQHALVFGTAVNLPTTFKVREAKPLPKSDDAKIGELWFHEEGRAALVTVAAPGPVQTTYAAKP
jgi:hypothetical protein